MSGITITLDEEERQATLMALAHLSLERPGWDYMLQKIAAKMDNKGCPMFHEFKTIHANRTEGLPGFDADYYCEIHKYNPLPGSGMAFCPECEGLLLEKVGGVSYVEGVEVDTGEFNEPTTSAKKMPRHQEGRTNEEPPSTDSEAHDAPTED